ncbi:adenosine deaminase [Streptomyces sp. ODS28]|uniref:adenosine deaminase family protein n=1 Tax=Streptomyces sp. ODS28 TaxID=3136688 RepID=UPI0031E59327
MIYTRNPSAGTRRALARAGLGALLVLTLLPAQSATAQQDSAAGKPASTGAPGKDGARPPRTPGELRAATYLDSVRQDPAKLRRFFTALPKGADLHNHLPGAATTELLIKLAGEKGLCIDRTTTAVAGPCDKAKGERPAADAQRDKGFREKVLRAWSMQDYTGDKGHDHFFDTFGKFDKATRGETGTMLSEVADSLARQNQSYLETMVSPAVDQANKLADSVGYDKDLGSMRRKLEAHGRMDRLVRQARTEADQAEEQFRRAGKCGTGHPHAGCRLPVRFISQVLRASSREQVFTQMVLGMRLAQEDPRFAAVNLVQPEDAPVSLRDYRLHMRMLGYLHRTYPRAHISLHAGELAPGMVKPEELTYHIREAVRTGKAERIGHGVDLRHEDGWPRLARAMAARDVPVEVPFTSNEQILGVKGKEHPFESYRKYGVPVVLATDDPGVSRTDISHQYQHAAQTYGLGYPELKDLARASLQYAFQPGRSLWEGRPAKDGYRTVPACRSERPGKGAPGRACAEYLAGNPKASLQWKLEESFAAFERDPGHAGR